MAGRQMNRQNEYFVPRDGIDREVITADICRYLGNDALVRPGTYENQETGQLIQGYYINAYRNLTTAMIEDLKEASRQWAVERSRVNGGITTYSNGFARRSNSPPAYRHSETHQRQQVSGMGGDPQYGNPGPGVYDARYQQPPQPPYQQQQQPPPMQNYPPQQGYNPGQGNYQYPPQQQNTYSPPARMDPYAAPSQGYAPVEQPYQAGGNLRAAYPDQPSERNPNYGGPQRGSPANMQQQQPGYPAPVSNQPYYPQGGPPQGGFVPQNQVQPQDPFLGRRPYGDRPGPGKEQPYASPDPSFDDQSTRTVTPTSNAASSSAPPPQRNRERDANGHRHQY